MYKNHHRHKFDIIASILDSANGNEVNQAEILVRTNITCSLLRICAKLTYQYIMWYIKGFTKLVLQSQQQQEDTAKSYFEVSENT